jgi:hypothetical protein
MDSTEGCDSSETRGFKSLVVSWPSKMMRKVLFGAPFTLISFQPLMLLPGARAAKPSGLRMAPAPIAKFSGSALMRSPLRVSLCAASSVFSRLASALTGDVFGCRSHGEPHVDTRGLGYLHIDTLLCEFLKSSYLDAEIVGA